MSKNNKEIKIGDWCFYNLPVQYSEADYDEARAELINKAKKTPDLIALFEYGCIPVLGISDMDFWGIFPDNAKSMWVPLKPVLSEKTREVMKHKIFILSEKHYRNMLLLDPFTTYPWPNGHRLLWQREDIKKDLNFEKIDFTKEEKNAMYIVFSEILLESVFSNISHYAKKEIPVRESFETLKDCVYAIEEINLISDKKVESDFPEKFKELRKNWFKLNQKEAFNRLKNILYQGLMVSFEAVFSIADWLGKNSQEISRHDLEIKKSHSALGKKNKNVYLITFRNKKVFTDLVKTPEEALKLSIDSYKKIKINLGWRTKVVDFHIIYQPFEISSIYSAMIIGNGLLTNSLRNNIFTNQENLPVFNSKIFQEKIKIVDEMTEFYNRKQKPDCDAKGFICGNDRFGYLFEKEGFQRKALNFWLKRKFWQTVNKNK